MAAATVVEGTVREIPDAMTWVVDDNIVRLWGVRPGPHVAAGAFADFARRIAAAGPVECRRQPASTRYRCETATGNDVAELALLAGLGRAPDGATLAYRDAEAEARHARRGLWSIP
jgi:hypothetical protein